MTDGQKRQLCREIALHFKAEKIMDDFLANNQTLELPPEWEMAVQVMKRNDASATIEKAVKKMVADVEARRIVECARRDAKKLSLKEINKGRTTDDEWEIV